MACCLSRGETGSSTGAAAPGFFAIGGGGNLSALQGTNDVWRYHIANNTWERYVDLPDVRFAPGRILQPDAFVVLADLPLLHRAA